MKTAAVLFVWQNVFYNQNMSSYFILHESIPARSSHSSIFHKNSLYLFCGELQGDQITNTTLQYSCEDLSWDVHYVPTGVPLTCRRNQTTVLVGNLVYLFGGDDNHNLNDMFTFDLDTRLWTKVYYESKLVCPPRRYHTSIYLDGKIYVFGGELDLKQMLNDLWAFDIQKSTWEELTPKGKSPEPRRYSTMIEWKKRLFVFGGRDNESRFNNLWEYNVGIAKWSEFRTIGEYISARASHTAVVYGSSMYIFGGMDGKELNSLCELDLETFRWKTINTKGTIPGLRYWHTSTISDFGVMYVHGGAPGDSVMDDFLRIQLRKRKFELKDSLMVAISRGQCTDVVIHCYLDEFCQRRSSTVNGTEE
jgi:N-acetylneuraminic acid mutarotase